MAVILITGAGSGFGYRMARRFASAGHLVYAGMHDLSDGDRLECVGVADQRSERRIDQPEGFSPK